MALVWDLLVRGGTLVDPAQSISARRDVAFSGGKVAAVAETLTGDATDVIDATGALLTPGLIDLHTHVYQGLATGRHADQTLLANGVTTVVDAGTTGWMTLPGLRDYVIPTYRITPPPGSGRVVYNLRGVMSKFLALGMPLDEVVASVTSRAAAAIGKSAELGSLAPGMAGDAAVLDLEDGRFTYVDGTGHELPAARRFRTLHVISAGRKLPAAHDDRL